jgi:hypothetical protein
MKRLTVNQKANLEMKKYCIEHEITTCELCHGAYCHNYFLTFAHKYKRRWFYDKPIEWLWDRQYWRLVGLQCHQRIEFDEALTEKLFQNQ